MSGIPEITCMNLRSEDITLQEIRQVWNAHDILVLFLEMDRYPPWTDLLTKEEKDIALSLRSGHFQNRYILSRTLLKILLREIVQTQSIAEITLSQTDQNRIRVNKGDYPWISLSYSQQIMALFLAKRRAAGDVEVVRPCSINLEKYPAFRGIHEASTLADPLAFWERWTRIEACTKCLGIPLSKVLENASYDTGIFFQSFLVNDILMCTVCSVDPESSTLVRFWREDLQRTDLFYTAGKILLMGGERKNGRLRAEIGDQPVRKA